MIKTETNAGTIDRRDPGPRFIEREIQADRRAERWLWLKAFVALSLVAGMIVVRQVFFS